MYVCRTVTPLVKKWPENNGEASCLPRYASARLLTYHRRTRFQRRRGRLCAGMGKGNGRGRGEGECESLLVRRYIDVRSDIRDTTGLCYAVIAHP